MILHGLSSTFIFRLECLWKKIINSWQNCINLTLKTNWIDNWSHLLKFTSVKRTFAVLKYASDNTCKQKYLPNEQPTQDFIFELKIEKLFKRKEHNVTFDEKILGYDKCTENGVILGNILVYVAK